MSYLVGVYSYDNPLVDQMPASLTRGASFIRPGINGFGVIQTGAGGQPFSLTIESYFSSWADAVNWGTLVQGLQKTFGTITTDRKSVVEGKRVDLGGRRIIKKKKQIKKQRKRSEEGRVGKSISSTRSECV